MNIFLKRKKSYIAAGGLAAFACVLMVVFPQAALLSAQKGIALWAGSVLPALLPFFIFANFLNYMGATAVLSPSAFTFAMSVMSGYPMGAKIIGDLRRRAYISAAEARRLLSFCSTSGPTFMIGAVGTAMLGSAAAGMAIAAAHYGAALINGALFTALGRAHGTLPKKGRGAIPPGGGLCPAREKQSLLELLTDAMLASFKSLGIILAYLVIFMFVTDLVQFSGVLNLAAAPFEKGFLKGLLEMTVGCASLAGCVDVSLRVKTILCAFLISWGGLSVIGQSMSMLSGAGIGFLYFLKVKLSHGVIAAILAFFLTAIVL